MSFITPASAQLLLTQSSYPATATWGSSTAGIADSIATCYNTTGLPTNLAAGTPGTIWNFSGLSYYTNDTSAVIHSTYSGFSYQDFALHIIAKPYLFYDARSLMNIGAGGITKFGEKLDGKGFSLAGATGAHPGDSIIFPQQIDTFSSPQTKILLPATYNTNWSSAYKVSVHFTLTYGGVYNHTPCTYNTYVTEKDTVINYGKAVVKRTDNLSSDSINVLEVKVIYKAVDSFFINGSRADSTLLSSFGLKQGQTINSTNEYRFMRANETTPLVDVFYTDNTFTTANQVYVHTQRVPLYTAVAEVTPQNNVDVYPNPVSGHAFTMHVPAALQGATYRIMNIAGQVLMADEVATTGNISVQLPPSARPGIYYLQVCKFGKVLSVKTLEVR